MTGFHGRDATRAVEAAIRDLARRAGQTVVACDTRARPWASVTFQGARHTLLIEMTGAAAARRDWLRRLGEDEIALTRHIAVDVAAEEIEDGRVRIEVLTVERD